MPVVPDLEVLEDRVRQLDAGVPAPHHRPLASLGYCHEAVMHSAAEYVRGDVHTNSIESLWSMFKRGYIGTYHHMSQAHLGRYVNEFAGRHNLREMGTEMQMETVVEDMAGTRLRYDDLVAAPAGTAVERDRVEPGPLPLEPW